MTENTQKKTVSSEDRTIPSATLWQQGMSAYSAIRKPALYLSLMGMAIPLLLVEAYFDLESLTKADEINALVAALSPGKSISFLDLVAILGNFATSYLGGLLLVLLIMSASYLATVKLAVNYYRAGPPQKAHAAFLFGVKTMIPRGALAFILLCLLVIACQALAMAPVPIFSPLVGMLGLVISVLSLMVPVLMITEQNGILTTIKRSLTLDFSQDRVPNPKWRCFLQTMSLGMVFYGALALISLAGSALLQLDETMSFTRSIYTATFPNTDYGMAYFLVNTLVILTTTHIAARFACLSAAFYFQAQRIGTSLSQEGIIA